MQMKIGVLLMSRLWGGAELHTVEFVHTLCERGHAASLVCLTPQTHKLLQDRSRFEIPATCLPMPKEGREMNIRDWLKLFKGQMWDACVFVKGAFGEASWALDIAARYRFGQYFTIEQLDADPIPPKTSRRHFGFLPGMGLWWYKLRLASFLRSVGPRGIVCVSDTGRRRLIDEYRFPERKLISIHNGIDPSQFSPNLSHFESQRQAWKIPKDALVFGAVGRLAPVKGYDMLLPCFQKLIDRYPDRDIRLVVVGEGVHEPTLRALSEKIKPAGRVVFAPFTKEPWKVLNALDVFVMPSLNEGLPMTLAEAMACGRCAIATDVGGIREVIASPNLGWLVPSNNPDEFSKAMIDVASRTPLERQEIGTRARQFIVSNFDSRVQFRALADYLEKQAVA